MDRARRLLPTTATACISDAEHHVWCGSALRAADGTWCLFCALAARFAGWVSHATVVCYVADAIHGPVALCAAVKRGEDTLLMQIPLADE